MDDYREMIQEFLELIDDGWEPVVEEMFEEIPQEVFEALNQRLKGALWQCGSCRRVFADDIKSVESSVFERAEKGCPFCRGHEDVMYLLAFLTEKELSEFKAIAQGTALGIVRVVPW